MEFDVGEIISKFVPFVLGVAENLYLGKGRSLVKWIFIDFWVLQSKGENEKGHTQDNEKDQLCFFFVGMCSLWTDYDGVVGFCFETARDKVGCGPWTLRRRTGGRGYPPGEYESTLRSWYQGKVRDRVDLPRSPFGRAWLMVSMRNGT